MRKRATPAVRFVTYSGRPEAPPGAPPTPRPVPDRPDGPSPRASPGPRGGTGPGFGTDGALALSRAPEPAPAVERPRPPAPLRLVRPDERAETDLDGIARATVRLVAEVLAGMRTPHHLAQQAIPEVCHGLAAHRAPVAPGTRIAPPRVLTTWLQEPAPGTAETGAVVVLDGRVQALALRLERRRGRWRCTALETTAAPAPRGR